MAPGMVTYCISRTKCLFYQSRIELYPFTNAEKGRVHFILLEDSEYLRSKHRAGSIVEGQCNHKRRTARMATGCRGLSNNGSLWNSGYCIVSHGDYSWGSQR